MTETDSYIPTNWKNNKSIIKVIGVGGGGGNAVSHMFRSGINDVDFIICNTDAQALEQSPVPEKLQLGSIITRGRGAGCNPEIARQAALESEERIKSLLSQNTEMVFITAGMGGGTGTGAAPVLARIARDLGLLTVAVVTIPFRDEGQDFLSRALDGVKELQQHVDSLLVIDNEKLYNVYGDLSVFDAFQHADDILNTAIKGITEIITCPGFMNVDFADVKMVMQNSGMALMGSGSGCGERRSLKAVEAAFTSPLLNDADLSKARNVLINIASGREKALSMTELAQIMSYIADYTGGVSNFKRGIICDESLKDEIRVTIIATGFSIHSLPPLIVYNNAEAEDDTETVVLSDEPLPNDEVLLPRANLASPNPTGVRIPEKPTVFPSPKSTPEPAAATPQLKVPVLIMEGYQNLAELETVPAYKRRKMEKEGGSAIPIEPSAYKLEEKDGAPTLSADNAFVHQTQD